MAGRDEDPDGDEDEPVPGLEEVLRKNLRGELHREAPGPGTVVDGKWELRRPLGAGGFGKVWEAWHLRLDHPVAIKILDARHGGTEVRQRFLNEARVMAGMSSEHLVRASDYGELPDGSPYFVMELVPGQTLRHWLRERMSMSRAREIAEEILEGLAEVHRRGIVHGDVKPENIVLGEDGKARLLDFGLARAAAATGEGIGGTPPYMAPEMLLEGAPASARTDVYAMGVVLYEMLTGRLPRGHVDMGLEQIRRAWERKPSASPVRMHGTGAREALGEIADALDELVMKALARDPAARLPSAQRMLDELRRLRPQLPAEAMATTLPELGTLATPSEAPAATVVRPPAAPRWTIGAAVAGAGAVAAAAIVAWWLLREPEKAADASAAPSTTIEPGLAAAELERARAGILVAIPDDASDAAARAYAAFCEALDGNRPIVEGTLPVYCRRVPATSSAETLSALAERAGVRAVVLVGDEALEVLSTAHHRGEPLLARLDGLPLPADASTLAQVAPLLKAVVGATGAAEVEIPVIALERVGPQWLALAEWLRSQQGHDGDEDRVRREWIKNRLDLMLERGEGESVGFYRDLAVLVWAGSANCETAEPALHELTRRREPRDVIRVAALLGRAECLVEGDGAASRTKQAQALLDEAFEASGDDACVRVAAIGTISRIDRWNGDDGLWQANASRLPDHDACEPAMWSKVLAVRGDALVDRGEWCDAARSYAQAYGVMRTKVEPLLAWAEYDWRCNPDRGAPRQELLEELSRASTSERLARAEQRLSVAYMRWWLTRDVADAERVITAYAEVADGEVALVEGVASDLEPEICAEAKAVTCSRSLLTRPKRAGDEEALRRSLGLR